MKKLLLDPFPIQVPLGINVTVPSGFILIWLLLGAFNLTVWLAFGAVKAVEAF